ncbi:hypothetical protein WCN91_00835 [Pseudoalteromonas sp. YIC-827]|uniref:Transposase n=1 Tax=Pseudoalteromonas qingdaonensis TaxID=3131913 RepID=A0ABU9MUL7_9GAMM
MTAKKYRKSGVLHLQKAPSFAAVYNINKRHTIYQFSGDNHQVAR